jgi:hypothetical protein
MAIIATQNCPDCCGRGTIYLTGSQVPCPSCREDDYADALLTLGIDPALEAVGNGMGMR